VQIDVQKVTASAGADTSQIANAAAKASGLLVSFYIASYTPFAIALSCTRSLATSLLLAA
jgi:hypothetical protein